MSLLCVWLSTEHASTSNLKEKKRYKTDEWCINIFFMKKKILENKTISKQKFSSLSHMESVEEYQMDFFYIYGVAWTMLINTDKCLLKIYGMTDEMIFSMAKERQRQEI